MRLGRLLLMMGTIGFVLCLPVSARPQTHGDHAGLPAEFGTVALAYRGHWPADLAGRIGETAGQAFFGHASERSFSDASRKILATLAAGGYHNAKLTPRDFALENGNLNFTLEIDPGPRFRIVGHQFDGLTHADTAWVRDVLALPVDVPFTAEVMSDAMNAFDRVTFLRPRAAPTFELTGNASDDQVPGILRWAIVEHRPARADGLIAAGGENTGSGLTGRASLRFGGLFGRDRSVALRYQRIRPEWTEFNVALNEHGAFGAPVDWGFTVDEYRQRDRRQTLAGQFGYRLHRTYQVNLGLLWRKTTPGTDAAIPARTTEIAIGITKQGRASHDRLHRGTVLQLRVDGVLSRRNQLASAEFDTDTQTANRLRIHTQTGLSHYLTRAWRIQLSAIARSWIDGRSTLGPGDEWYLGGDEQMRGYDEQTLAAASGLWTALELEWSTPASLTMAVFGETATLRTMTTADNSAKRVHPLSYGLALGLRSNERRARLELAWRDKVRWQDGIIRLHISQNW